MEKSTGRETREDVSNYTDSFQQDKHRIKKHQSVPTFRYSKHAIVSGVEDCAPAPQIDLKRDRKIVKEQRSFHTSHSHGRFVVGSKAQSQKHLGLSRNLRQDGTKAAVPKHLPNTKSMPQLQKDVRHLHKKGKSTTTLKQALSWNELQFSASPINKSQIVPKSRKSKIVPKQFLKKWTKHSLNKSLKLPILAPVEKKILAEIGQRDWIFVDEDGKKSIFTKDKHVMTHELGIQIRDLRLLDPLLTSTYPSAILSREKALVVNLEYIKCIITRNCVYIPDANLTAVKVFTKQLQQRLEDGTSQYSTIQSFANLSQLGVESFLTKRLTLPFELRILEVSLDNVCKHMECQYLDLEMQMHGVIGKHTVSKLTTDYLERFRRLKTRLVRLQGRVESLKDMLDKILSDEGDMIALNLSARILNDLNVKRQIPLVFQSLADSDNDKVEEPGKDIMEVEMLLSAYYLQMDSIWKKLADVSEFVDDAEELSKLEMDAYRNNVLRMKVFLGMNSFLIGCIWAIGNIFGSNLANIRTLDASSDDIDTHMKFLEVSIGSCGSVIFLIFLATYVLHVKQLAVTTITR